MTAINVEGSGSIGLALRNLETLRLPRNHLFSRRSNR